MVISTSGFSRIGGPSFTVHIKELKFTGEDEDGNVKTHELEKNPDSITVSGADISIVLDDDREEINELLNDSAYISADKNWATGSGFTTEEKTIPVTISNIPDSPTGEDEDTTAPLAPVITTTTSTTNDTTPTFTGTAETGETATLDTIPPTITISSGSTNTPPSIIGNTSVAFGGLSVTTNTTASGNGSTNTTTTIDGDSLKKHLPTN